ncbi:hypothetical protein D917_09021 [Trichinella nativa]|uniref:Uncharacterized protein n=1 Tax=Trichinella nativa TaxID=6335 RepID=A0A1Y3EH93_9BILA|nr:hypothetical protein D917_09021 [Trichinella nativa]
MGEDAQQQAIDLEQTQTLSGSQTDRRKQHKWAADLCPRHSSPNMPSIRITNSSENGKEPEWKEHSETENNYRTPGGLRLLAPTRSIVSTSSSSKTNITTTILYQKQTNNIHYISSFFSKELLTDRTFMSTEIKFSN